MEGNVEELEVVHGQFWSESEEFGGFIFKEKWGTKASEEDGRELSLSGTSECNQMNFPWENWCIHKTIDILWILYVFRIYFKVFSGSGVF